MQENTKNNVMKLLAKEPLDVKDLVKALKKVAGLEDINKSAVNKLLYAGEKTGQFVKNAETPPVWSLKEGTSSPKSASVSPKTSPEQERPVVKVFKPKETTYILDWSAMTLIGDRLNEISKIVTEHVHVKVFGYNLNDIPKLEKIEYIEVLDDHSTIIQVSVHLTYLMSVEKQDVILVSSDEECHSLVEVCNRLYKSDVKIINPTDFMLSLKK